MAIVEFSAEGTKRALIEAMTLALPQIPADQKDKIGRLLGLVAAALHRGGGFVGCALGSPLHVRSGQWQSAPPSPPPPPPPPPVVRSQAVQQPPFSGAQVPVPPPAPAAQAVQVAPAPAVPVAAQSQVPAQGEVPAQVPEQEGITVLSSGTLPGNE